MSISRRQFVAFTALTPLAAISRGFAAPAQGKKWFALVVGNGAYLHMAPVRTATSDAATMSSVFASLGFQVTTVLNASLADMRSAVLNLSAAVQAAGPQAVALVYYAGQGVQIGGESYLMPVEAKLSSESDALSQGVAVQELHKVLESAQDTTLLALIDAPRTNPFLAPGASLNSRGYAIVDAPTGSLISYSTAPGSNVVQSSGPNSHYAVALIEAMKPRGRLIDQVFKDVRLRVHRATDGRQIPWDSSSLARHVFLSADAQ